jgi:DNA-binding CsgD family transcriptional regulator
MAVRERERNRCRERLEPLAHAGLDPVEARQEAIIALRRTVGFERWCWPTTDPDSALATGGLAEFDLWPTLPRLIALEEHGDLTSKPRLAVRRRASSVLSAEAGGDLARSRRWRECLAPYGIGDELMTVCRDRHGCWGSVELMRDSDDPTFGDDDARFLNELSPTLARLLRTALPQSWPLDQPESGQLPPATLIMDPELQPATWTPGPGEWLDALSPGGSNDGAEMLPPAVYEIGARVLTPAAEATALPPTVRLRTRTGHWATIEGAPLEGAGRGNIAITFRIATAHEIFDLLAKTYDLTRRERQLVALVLDGLATKQLALALSISPHTIQDHLKTIFAKTNVRSRRELISHLGGRMPEPRVSESCTRGDLTGRQSSSLDRH